MICLVNSVNERDPSLLNSARDANRGVLLRRTAGVKPEEGWGHNRSVMPLDNLGRTRNTMMHSVSITLLGREAWRILVMCIVLRIEL